MDFSGLEVHKNEERKGFMDRRHRKKMMLPHLSYSYKKEAETQDKSLPKHKFDDLMIGTDEAMQIYIRMRKGKRSLQGIEVSPSINLPLQASRSKEILKKKSGQNPPPPSPSSSSSKIDIARRPRAQGSSRARSSSTPPT